MPLVGMGAGIKKNFKKNYVRQNGQHRHMTLSTAQIQQQTKCVCGGMCVVCLKFNNMLPYIWQRKLVTSGDKLETITCLRVASDVHPTTL
jgi:hypothetical protein